jgi:hypothetical protein
MASTFLAVGCSARSERTRDEVVVSTKTALSPPQCITLMTVFLFLAESSIDGSDNSYASQPYYRHYRK